MTLHLTNPTRRLLITLLAVFSMVVAALPTALLLPAEAVHDAGLFELDNDAMNDTGIAGEDWNMVAPPETHTALAATFVSDSPPDGNYFQTGGSKDVRDVSDWEWNASKGGIPDKDEITNAYAAAYQHPSTNDLHVHFGMDRFAGDGSAAIGFWFLQDDVDLVPGSPRGTFSGNHVPGDVLVLSDFTNGGGVSTIRVFEWVGGKNPLVEVTGGTKGDCDDVAAADGACATVNDEDVAAPWPYTPKAGPAGVFPPGHFFEGGINLTQLVGFTGCFSSFVAETRSSHSLDSQLHDVALGEFELCSLDIEKTGDTLSKVGDPVDYEITITNTGSATMHLESIDDDVAGDLKTPALNTGVSDLVNGCGASLAAGADCTISYTYEVQEGDDDPLVNTVEAVYNESPALTGHEITVRDSHSTNLFQPGISVTKTGDAASKVGDTVTYTVDIENTSSDDSPDLVFDSISDTIAGDLLTPDLTDHVAITSNTCGASLAWDASCAIDYSYTVQENDPDPLPNTVTVHTHPDGFPNDIWDDDDHEVELFTPAVQIVKSSDRDSKVGDPITYTFDITNMSSHDAPELVLDSIVDEGDGWDGLGDLEAAALAADCGTLGYQDTCSFDVTYTVQSGDPDPLKNTVEVHYHPDGFSNDIWDDSTHENNLFQPSVTIDKSSSGDSKVGDDITYTFEITNTSSDDAPDLVLESISDAGTGWDGLGDLYDAAEAEGCDVLETDEICSFDVVYTVQELDPDPLENRVDVLYHPDGFPNDITAFDTDSTNLFQPGVDVDIEADALSKATDPVTYTITVTNTSSDDSPDLTNGEITSALLGDLLDGDNSFVTGSDCGTTLATRGSCTITAVRTVLSTDPDPLEVSVSVYYNPDGFPNDIEDDVSTSTNLFQPNVTVTKSGTELSEVGAVVSYSFTIANSGSPDSPDLLLESVTDVGDGWAGLGELTATAAANDCDRLPVGESCSFTVDRTVQETDPDPLTNTVSVLYHPEGFPNDITDSDDHTTELFQTDLLIVKSSDGDSKVGDPITYTFAITNLSSSDSPDLVLDSVSDVGDGWAGLGDLTEAAAAAGCDVLGSGDNCSFDVVYTVQAGDPDPLRNTVTTHYQPDGFASDVNDGSTHETGLFQPSVVVDKSGTELARVGDTVTYDFTVTNISSADSPDLVLESMTDIGDGWEGLGDLTAAATSAGCGELAPGDSCTFSVGHTVSASNPDPLDNTVAALYHPDGFPNDIVDTDDHSTDIIHPAIEVVKTADIEPTADGLKIINCSAGGCPETTFEFVVTNTGDSVLTDVILTDDKFGAITLADTTLDPGESTTGSATYVPDREEIDAGTHENLATVTGTSPIGPDVTDTDPEVVDIIEVLPNVIERPEPPPAPAPAPEPAPLPRTGADAAWMSLTALLALLLGWSMVWLGRRREIDHRA